MKSKKIPDEPEPSQEQCSPARKVFLPLLKAQLSLKGESGRSGAPSFLEAQDCLWNIAEH